VSAVSGDETANPPLWQLLVVIPVTVLVVAAFISIPAHVGARRPAAETSKLNSLMRAKRHAPDYRSDGDRRRSEVTDTRSIDDSALAGLGHPSRHNDVARTVSATPGTDDPRLTTAIERRARFGDLERVTISTRRRWPWPC
jgi:hypothetical protein